MDRIAGFERYLLITEEERLETLHPPEKTPELFERYLPHAIALGVENRWAGKFARCSPRPRPIPAGRAAIWLVFGQPERLVQPRHVRHRGRRARLASSIAGGLDRAGIEQRLGRRRLVRRRRRRRWRRRLVG